MKHILIICDDAGVRGLIAGKTGETNGVHGVATLAEALGRTGDAPWDLVFIDVTQPVEAAFESFESVYQAFRRVNPLVQLVALAPKEKVRKAVSAVRCGASDYLTYPIDGTEIDLVLDSIRQTLTRDLELEYLRDHFWKSDWLDIIRTRTPEMHSVLKSVRSVAPTIATVLLTGETGTGKGLMARLIHRHSHRCDGPFVAVHCGAIPETLIESELFGHEKGAYTGADRKRIGRFEMAGDGTIFLDEIGTITPGVQIKLLQVLQDGTYSRVGGGDCIHTNARIIAATNANLSEMAESGAFRKDLFYRLNVFPLELPPLRQRKADLSHLVDIFLASLRKKYGKPIVGLENGLIDILQDYHWPGNLRELENILERAFILESGSRLKRENLPGTLVIGSRIIQTQEENKPIPLSEARHIAIDEFERTYLEKLLRKHGGRINLSAKEADITSRQLSRLAAKHGLDKKTYKR